MRRVILALSVLFAGYTALVYALGDGAPPAAVAATPQVSQGAALWRDLNCQGCHQLYGLGGYMGPDLTNTARFRGPAYMKAFIKNGSSRMPNFHLSDTAIDQLTAFLTWVDATGLSLPPAKSVHWSGTYQISER